MVGTTEWGARVILFMIRSYQTAISPRLPPACRYNPSCSAYAAEAVGRFGAGRGSWLAIKRLLRCHPLGGKGYDPVPQREVA
jgi:putative membrane protein insertion efficiency factor